MFLEYLKDALVFQSSARICDYFSFGLGAAFISVVVAVSHRSAVGSPSSAGAARASRILSALPLAWPRMVIGIPGMTLSVVRRSVSTSPLDLVAGGATTALAVAGKPSTVSSTSALKP